MTTNNSKDTPKIYEELTSFLREEGISTSSQKAGEVSNIPDNSMEDIPKKKELSSSQEGIMDSNWNTQKSSELIFQTEGGTPFQTIRREKAHWSVPWADLMMTMFIFFAILYIYHGTKESNLYKKEVAAEVISENNLDLDVTIIGKKAELMEKEVPNEIKDNPIPEEIKKEPEQEFTDLNELTLKPAHLDDFASIDLAKDKTVRIILTSDLLFDTGKANLKLSAEAKLRKLGKIIGQSPYMINVVGHTDNVPIQTKKFPSNWELSAIRACIVGRFLMEEMKVNAERFYVTGHANYQPLVNNNTSENRATNRRVEILVTKNKPRGIPG